MTAAPAIIAAGARTPLGLTSLQAAMLLRAGAMSPEGTGLHDSRGHDVGACLAAGFHRDAHGFERMARLAAPALRECVAGLGSALHEPPPAVIAVPERGRPDDDARFETELLSALSVHAALPLRIDRSATIRAGHAGGALALAAATEMLRAGAAPVVLVGGVDSYIHPGVLSWLDAAHRLHGPETEDGFIPGEAAAFVAVTLEGGVKGVRPLARVLDAAEAREQAPDGEPDLASAMTGLVRRMLHATGGAPPGWLITDVNGERHRVRAWTKVLMRRIHPASPAHTHLGRALGDVGAATGVVAAALSCALWGARCAPARAALVALHAEGPERGAFVLSEAA